jgi:hypothetical protein
MASALPLLVARILANDADDILALHDAAGFAKPLDGCSYFHGLKIGFDVWRTKNRAGINPSAIGHFATFAGR